MCVIGKSILREVSDRLTPALCLDFGFEKHLLHTSSLFDRALSFLVLATVPDCYFVKANRIMFTLTD